jgi:transcription elongation factor Elf1
MGRRKAAKKVVKKKKASVARVFKCLFCNHQDVVSCQMDMKSMTGLTF